jgi:hypothetical protein
VNQDWSYVRSDLSTAYNRAGDPADTPNRKLEYFYRSFLYLRAQNVFVVYDQVKAKPSANPRGAYRKHLRWHLPDRPVISGRTAQLGVGQSRLFLDTLLPVNATLTAVDELSNPDPCDGSDSGCVPFGISNAGTFRIEVRDPQNPLIVPFLTVLKPGSSVSTAPANTRIAAIDGKMIGVEISQAGGVRNIVLFNNQTGQVPQPITSTSYNVSGSGSGSHTLLGVVPNARYFAVLSNGVMQVDQSPNGDRRSSPAGVLHFSLPRPATQFMTLTPCRILDTRSSAGPLGGPALSAGQMRIVVPAGTCSIPVTAQAVSVNVTVTEGVAAGYLTLYPADGAAPLASNINFRPGQSLANNAVVRVSTDGAGSLAILNGSGGQVHVILDVNGYFE